jgi:hypothetical protein
LFFLISFFVDLSFCCVADAEVQKPNLYFVAYVEFLFYFVAYVELADARLGQKTIKIGAI